MITPEQIKKWRELCDAKVSLDHKSVVELIDEVERMQWSLTFISRQQFQQDRLQLIGRFAVCITAAKEGLGLNKGPRIINVMPPLEEKTPLKKR